MKITLRIYNAPSGQWAGKFISEGVEIGGIAGCDSADEVQSLALEQGYEIVEVELYKSFI
jgi:hypothetical protein